jgi:hypothetical protein
LGILTFVYDAAPSVIFVKNEGGDVTWASTKDKVTFVPAAYPV